LHHIILSFLLLTLAFANIPRHAGAIAGGERGAEIGYAVALSAEANNRQLHQKEIKLIRENAGAFVTYYKKKTGKTLSAREAEAMLAQTALAGVDSDHASHLNVDANAKAFLLQVAEKNGGVAFVDSHGRTQHMFNETDRSLYNNHAVNANEMFTDGAREVYDAAWQGKYPKTQQSYYANTVADLAQGSKDLANEGAADYQHFIINASELSNDGSFSEHERTKLRESAQAGVVHGMNYGAIDRSEVSLTGDNELSRIYQGSLVDGSQAVGAALGGPAAIRGIRRLGHGKVRVELEGGKSAVVPESAVVKGADGKIYIKDSYKAPERGTGNSYTVYKRNDIDLDKPIVYQDSRGRTVTTTNRELMSEGKAPYIYKNGRYQQVQLHHSRQNANGPLFEVTESTHRAKTGKGGEALHPYKTKRGQQLNGEGGGANKKSHPYHPVDRNKFNTDRNQYWKDRLRESEKKGEE